MINDRMENTKLCTIFLDGGFLTLPSCSISEGDKLCSKFALLFFVQDIFFWFSQITNGYYEMIDTHVNYHTKILIKENILLVFEI